MVEESVTDNNEEEINSESINDSDIEKNRKGCLSGFGCCILLIISALLLLYMLFFCDFITTYHRFGKKRTELMEQKFGISVTDDIVLEQYRDNPPYWLDDGSEILDIRIDDLESFFDKNIKAEIYDYNEEESTLYNGKKEYGTYFRYNIKNDEKQTVYGHSFRFEDEDTIYVSLTLYY